MSDTPRTESKIVQWSAPKQDWLVPATFARELEREADQLVKQCVRNVEEIGQLRAELREAKKDSERLDWLIAEMASTFWDINGVNLSRESIDAAMEATNHE